MRPPQMSDYSAWAELRALSREHLMPWEPLWPRDELTVAPSAAVRTTLASCARIRNTHCSFSTTNERLLGGLDVVQCSAWRVRKRRRLGLVGAPYIRRGYMTEAVPAMIPFAQEPWRLHRVEAACLK